MKDIELSRKNLTLFDQTHMMSRNNLVAFSVQTPMIDSRCSLEKEFIKLIDMDP